MLRGPRVLNTLQCSSMLAHSPWQRYKGTNLPCYQPRPSSSEADATLCGAIFDGGCAAHGVDAVWRADACTKECARATAKAKHSINVVLGFAGAGGRALCYELHPQGCICA